ncbi:MAG: HAMP domain-containing histidine kinase [Planctomycetes bacterium]|nr:HAMP domain-containing histidine kinase [Planctomycetota bacterium]
MRYPAKSVSLGLVFTFALAGALTAGALVAYFQVKQGFEEQLERRLRSYATAAATGASVRALENVLKGKSEQEEPLIALLRSRQKALQAEAGVRRVAVVTRAGVRVLDTAGGKPGETDYGTKQDANELEQCFVQGKPLVTAMYEDASGRAYRNAFAPVLTRGEGGGLGMPSDFAAVVELEADYFERLGAIRLVLGACVLGVFVVTLGAALLIMRKQAKLRADLARQTRLAELAQFSAGMAHQIKNPLGAMRGYTELLARTLNEPMQKQLAEKLVAETGMLDRVVRDFLAFSRGAHGSSERLTLETLLSPTIEAARARGGDTVKISLSCDNPSAELEADANAVRQALVNVTVNAAEALCERGGRVEVLAHAGPRQIAVEVKDDGPGMPADIKAKLFEPFTTGKADGTGLGLAISRRLLRDMGGDLVLIQSGPTGTIFKATFDRYWSVRG